MGYFGIYKALVNNSLHTPVKCTGTVQFRYNLKLLLSFLLLDYKSEKTFFCLCLRKYLL